MKCELCKKNNAEKLKSGEYRLTVMDTAEQYDMSRGKKLCKECRKKFLAYKKESWRLKKEKERAPLNIIKDILSLQLNEEWNLKLADAEYYIKRIK